MSKRWLANDYVHWKAVPGLNADEEDDDSDEAEEDGGAEDDLEEATATDSDGDD